MWVLVKIRAPFLGALNSRCRVISGTQKGTLILTTTHVIQLIRLYALAKKLTWSQKSLQGRGSIYTTIMEITQNHNRDGLLGP